MSIVVKGAAGLYSQATCLLQLSVPPIMHVSVLRLASLVLKACCRLCVTTCVDMPYRL